MLRFLYFFNGFFGKIGSLFQSPLLLLLRLFFGISFMLAGWSKLQDISKFADTLLTLHVPYPETMAWIAALTEFVGGFFLAIGFLSRIAALPLIIVMCVAYATAHAESLYALTKDPVEFIRQPPFNYLLASLLVFAFGPGLFSLDALLSRRTGKEEQKPAK